MELDYLLINYALLQLIALKSFDCQVHAAASATLIDYIAWITFCYVNVLR